MQSDLNGTQRNDAKILKKLTDNNIIRRPQFLKYEVSKKWSILFLTIQLYYTIKLITHLDI